MTLGSSQSKSPWDSSVMRFPGQKPHIVFVLGFVPRASEMRESCPIYSLKPPRERLLPLMLLTPLGKNVDNGEKRVLAH